MSLMRCIFCGLLQDEPKGVKECNRCGGELAYEGQAGFPTAQGYVKTQLELDQVLAPAGCNVDRYLLLTLRTPDKVPFEYAAQEESGRPPLNFCIVLDVSGSMGGEKIQQAKQAVLYSLKHLHDGDFLSLVTFSNSVQCILESTPFDSELKEKVKRIVDEIQAGGMTALDEGLEKGIDQALRKSLSNNLVLLLSDGQANVGVTDLERVGLRSHKARQKNLVVSTLGIGLDYNEALMAEISTQGGGRFYHLKEAHQIPAYVAGEMGEIAFVAARQTRLEIDLPDGTALIPLSSAYPAELTDHKVSITIGEIPLDTELEIPLRLTLFSQAEGKRLSFSGWISYNSPSGAGLSTILNQVTVRFVASSSFQLSQGLAETVAEKVIGHMRAAYVIHTARVAARDRKLAIQTSEQEAKILREYAEKISPDMAEEIDEALTGELNMLAASPAQAKDRLAVNYARVRAVKKFDK